MSTHETEWLARLAATKDYKEHEGVSWLHKPIPDPLVSPLFAPDVTALPPARLIQYRGMDHAFMDKLGDYPQAEDCMNEIANALKEMTR